MTFKELSSLRSAIPRAASLIRPPRHQVSPGPRECSSPGNPWGSPLGLERYHAASKTSMKIKSHFKHNVFMLDE